MSVVRAPFSYNSCRSRCCSKCRRRLASGGFRSTTRSPQHQLLPRCLHPAPRTPLTSRRPVLDLLFEAVSRPCSILPIPTPRRRIGFLSILHTWGSNLLPHYHIHCVVPGGGYHQRWIPTSHPMFLLRFPSCAGSSARSSLPVSSFIAGLASLRGPAAPFRDSAWFEQLIDMLSNKKWYVYAKPPAAAPTCAALFGRYPTMAISNHRITAFDGKRVSFLWRDYRTAASSAS